SANFGNTGGFQTYANVVINNVNLSAGTQELRLDMKSNDFNLNYIELVPTKPVADQIAPVVKLENTPDNSDTVTLNQLTNSTTTANFSVTFADNIGIDVATIDANDVTITAPNGSTVPVSLVGINTNGNGTPRTATYSIAAPGGTWDVADVGDYSITINAAAVSGTSGNTTTAKTIGKLALNVLTPVSDGVIRINAGASADAVDSFGKLWQADANFIGGQAIAPSYNPIDNTKDDFIYQSQRVGTNFSYAIPVANGNYNVSLHFSELNFTDADKRIFNVSSEGQTVLNNLDLYRSTRNAFLDGENDANIQKIHNIAKVTDGKLNLNFTSQLDQAALAGIVITPIKGAKVLVEESQQLTAVTEGGNSDTYQILLNEQPTANVTINLQLDGQTSVDKNSLIFTPQNWSTPQTVTVKAIDDTLGESFHSSTIKHTIATTDSAYSALTIPDVTVKITDNDLTEVKFKPQQEIAQIEDGFYGTTSSAWGPDGRLYVALASGLIKAYTFDDNYKVTSEQSIDVIKGLSNPNITGIAFNPFENDGSQPKLYVSHNKFYANPSAYGEGGFDELTEFSPYSGQVSVLTGANFNTLNPLVQNIGVSNHDHGVNGLAFDANGDLLITSGSNTNAGIADDAIGGIDESPFTAGILKAQITKPNFNGKIIYQLPADWVAPAGLTIPNPEASQGFGGIVKVAPGVDVSVYAPGMRNPFDLVFATNGKVYATENDANSSFGDVSLSATTQEPFNLDPLNEINIVEEGNYYGQPNRNRGKTDNRQNTYHPSYEPSKDGYTAPIGQFDLPIQGIIEYRSTAFGGQLRGNLLTQEFNGSLHNVKLSPDGTKIDNTNLLEPNLVDAQGQPIKVNPFYTTKPGDNPGEIIYNSKGLDVITGFAGAIIGLNESDSRVAVIVPDDDAITAMTAYEISDWRAPAKGGGQFTIGGVNFSGLTTDTSVTIGNKTATITSVTGKRIVGIFPTFDFTDPIFASTEYTEDKLLNITVASGGEVSIITDAFQPLFI
ncbi:MAG TPA: malectin domain-containing carbohydrate-binding protein, partial [Coleofasciculaceae cyanobacterium]